MFVEYCGRKLVARISASRELEELGLELLDVREVLEYGFDCASGGGRKPGVVEKCLRKGDKVLRVVIAQGIRDLAFERDEVYYVIHVSQETWKNRRFGQRW